MNPIIRATYLNEDEDEKDHYVGKFFFIDFAKGSMHFFFASEAKTFLLFRWNFAHLIKIYYNEILFYKTKFIIF